ncbi:sensor histidine kinase [Sandarakinorhabdus sp. DWP1-3-1]|uniref:sensor histidine kinase n=1 Tax=Sandarakinorhabdus sp. DWP1-3-1 TaxID=2804627 RepID=UPI003CED7466
MDTDRLSMDAFGFELWGLPWKDEVSFDELSAHIHPADRDRVRAAFQATRSVSGLYETDFRIMLGDEIRWVSARGKGADEGLQDRSSFGVFIDVTQRKQAEEANELLAGEMSHRVLNLLTIATSLTNMTGRKAASVPDMTKELVQRLTALGRAHSLVRPLPGTEGRAALLGDLIAVLLSPYDDGGAFAGRIRTSVPRMGVGETSATTLAMVIHELATNSLKHGALSVPSGMLEITSTSDDDDLVIVWAETGGPAVASVPDRQGYGSRVVLKTVEQQLRGELAFDWQAAGLVAKLRVKRSRLAL